MSRHHFCKIFKQAAGLMFTEFLVRVRVENAKKLLRGSRLRVTDLANGAGFDSISQFNRVFRRYAGNSPAGFRAALRQAERVS